MNPKYTIEHHTAASVDITNMLINGRPDLNGPLCNFELRKDGTVGLLASGRANHAGVASVSATESYGIEATGPVPTGNTGVDAFPNYKAYVGLVAAICRHHGWGMDRVKAHKEIAPDRKIDPVFDDAFRRAVDAAKKGGGEDEMTDKQMAELKRYIDLKMRETVRYMDHSDPKTPFQGHSLNKVRAEIADLRKLVIAEGARELSSSRCRWRSRTTRWRRSRSDATLRCLLAVVGQAQDRARPVKGVAKAMSPESWQLLVGVLLPPLIAVVQQPRWPDGIRAFVTLFACSLVGAIIHGVQVDWDLDTDTLGAGGAVLRILLATWASYLAFWKHGHCSGDRAGDQHEPVAPAGS